MAHGLKSGVYEHYTGLLVFVLGVARHSETEEKFVAYIPLAPKRGPRITVRPLTMFFEDVEVNGQKRSRFRYVGAEMPEDLANKYKSMNEWGQPGEKS
jgi:hypothetical protein